MAAVMNEAREAAGGAGRAGQIPSSAGMPVPHGFRSTFKDWCTEQTGSPPNKMSEMALAHTVPDKVEAAYRRGGWQRGADKGVILCLYIWNFDAEQGPATLH